MRIAPNHSQGIFQIQLDKNKPFKGSLSVINIMGKVMYTEKYTTTATNNTIEMALDLKPGMYFVTLKEKNNQVSKKIIVE
jgi:hypothetical protein